MFRFLLIGLFLTGCINSSDDSNLSEIESIAKNAGLDLTLRGNGDTIFSAKNNILSCKTDADSTGQRGDFNYFFQEKIYSEDCNILQNIGISYSNGWARESFGIEYMNEDSTHAAFYMGLDDSYESERVCIYHENSKLDSASGDACLPHIEHFLKGYTKYRQGVPKFDFSTKCRSYLATQKKICTGK